MSDRVPRVNYISNAIQCLPGKIVKRGTNGQQDYSVDWMGSRCASAAPPEHAIVLVRSICKPIWTKCASGSTIAKPLTHSAIPFSRCSSAACGVQKTNRSVNRPSYHLCWPEMTFMHGVRFLHVETHN